MSGQQQQIGELLSGFASRLSSLLKSIDDDHDDNSSAESERILANESPSIAPSLLQTLRQIKNLAEEAKHEFSSLGQKEAKCMKSRLHSQRIPFFSDVKSPLHGVSGSVTVLSSSNEDGQSSHWDAGVGMVADRLTNRPSYSISRSSDDHPSRRTTVIVNRASESKMQLRSRSICYDTSFLSSSASSESDSENEDDPSFRVSADSTDFEDRNSIGLDEVTPLQPTAPVLSDAASNNCTGTSISNPSLHSGLPCLLPGTESAIESKDISSHSVQLSVETSPLLSRIRQCHVVLNKIDPSMSSIGHRPLVLKPEREKEITSVTFERGASCDIERAKPSRQGCLDVKEHHTFHEVPGNIHNIPETRTSGEDEEVHTLQSCASVGGSEHHKKELVLAHRVDSGDSPSRQSLRRIVSGSFDEERPFEATCPMSPPAQGELDKLASGREDPLEQGLRVDAEVPHPAEDSSSVNDSLPLSHRGRQVGLRSDAMSSCGSEVDILHVQEDSPKIHSSRRKGSRPKRMDINMDMDLSQEDWLSPYEFESEEVVRNSESPSLLAHSDFTIPTVEDHVDHVQMLSKFETSSEELVEMSTGENEEEQMPTPSTTDQPTVPSVIQCTSCNREICWESDAILTNPRLDVLVCMACWKYFQKGSFYVDDDGKETYCSLCGEGGSVVCCDSCEKTFCFACISRISGKSFLDSLLDSNNEEEWLCYSCNPAPISSHQALARSLLQLLRSRKNQKEKAPLTSKRKRSTPVVKSQEFVSSSSGFEDEEKEGIINRQNYITRNAPLTRKETVATSLSPRSNISKPALRTISKNDVLKWKSLSGSAHRSAKRPVVSSSSDDGTKYRCFKRKCSSPPATPPQQLVCAMSDDSDFDLSATPVLMKKVLTPLFVKREKRSTSESVCSGNSSPKATKKITRSLSRKQEKRKISELVCSNGSSSKVTRKATSPLSRKRQKREVFGSVSSEESSPKATEKATSPLSRKQENTSWSVCSEEEHMIREWHKCKEETVNDSVQFPESNQASSHTLVSIDDTMKSTSNESSDSGHEVKSEEVSLSDDDVFDLPSRQKSRVTKKQDTKETNSTFKPNNISKRRPGLSLRTSRFSQSEYRPPTYNEKEESVSSSDVIPEKQASDTSSSVIASSSQHSSKKRSRRVESTTPTVSGKAKRRHCLADDLSSGSDGNEETIKKLPSKTLLNFLSSEGESTDNAGNSSNVLKSATLPNDTEVNGIFPVESQDVEYQVVAVSSSSSDFTTKQRESDQPRRKVKRKVIISSDSSDRYSNHLTDEVSTSTKGVSSSEEDFQEGRRCFRGKRDYFARKRKKKSRPRVIVTTSDEEGVSKVADSDYEDSESEEESQGKEKDVQGKRRNIRKLMPDKKLADQTKLAQKVERERMERLKKRNRSLSEQDGEIADQIILDKDPETDEVRLEVRPRLVPKILKHQRQGIKFLFNSCCEDLDRMKNEEGSGAILAHCMGLGKTLQVIAFLDAFFNNDDEQFMNFKALILCPVNTLLNWVAEYNRWIPMAQRNYHVWPVNDQNTVKRFNKLERWYNFGGVAIMGYDMFRNMAMGKHVKTKRKREAYKAFLLDPGADFIVCDEGHILRHEASNLSRVINQVKTKRRIVLSGTPLQNSLKEYYTMVNFVKPNLLGTAKEFHNRFINPITNGQCRDSRAEDVRLMKQRAHVLYELLQGCVDRRDYSILAESLPPKLEFVISIRMCPLQADLINRYLQRQTSGIPTQHDLFSTFSNLTKVWNHPWILKLDEQRKEKEELRRRLYEDLSDNGFIVSDSVISEEGETTSTTSTSAATKEHSRSSSLTSDGTREVSPPSRSCSPSEPVKGDEVTKKWFSDLLTDSCEVDVNLSGKLLFLRELLNETEKAREKVLLFSQSLLLLNFIEELIQKPETGFGEMIEGVHYYRLDGSTKQGDRADFMSEFNKANNRIRLFLISTKAGSLGVNLIGANRVIIFDTCWNPSHDLQSIFRTYRFGQTKPVFVYRLLAQGTMEEKIYDRQVTKQSLSMRVVDQMQIGRHYSFSELQELFAFTPASPPPENPAPLDKPQDDFILSNILDQLQSKWVIGYHKHDSLLEHQFGEELSEEERKLAWENYNASKRMESHVYNVGLQAGTPSATVPDTSLPQSVVPPLMSQNKPDLVSQPIPFQQNQLLLTADHIRWQRSQTQQRITGSIVQLFNIGLATCEEANTLIAQKNNLVPFLHDPVHRQNYEAISASLNRKLLVVNSTNKQIRSILMTKGINEVLSDPNRHQLQNLHQKYSAKLRELEQNQNASNMLPYSLSSAQ